jgi:hypothetical protein
LISCPLTDLAPRLVSLTEKPCDTANNSLKVIDNKPVDGVKREFGVCVKQLTYPSRDFIVRFIEWIEILRILGNTKVHFYNRLLHQEIIDVVKYYEKKDLVEMFDFLEPSGMSNQFSRSPETMALEHAILNDCFYRVKNLYKYVLIIDTDEVIVPSNETDRSWMDLFKRFNSSYDVYPSRMMTFSPLEERKVEGVPSYLYMLTHVEVGKHSHLKKISHLSSSFQGAQKTKYEQAKSLPRHRESNRCVQPRSIFLLHKLNI